ncbi:MAG: TonB-dependent receptor [Tannerellaceae bacterium]|jgi:TonB-linked SusC/RagA family outer membrane protein|nr:TonB-dependent receptor [Tannerellaceae bacterium]
MKVFLILFCIVPIFSFALDVDEGKMRGKVVDMNGEPLAGVAIHVTGGTKGTITDSNGAFGMDNVKLGEKFTVTYLGMQDTEFVYQGKDVTIVLKEKENELDEVIVVAFGKQKKESVIASVITVKPSDLKVPSSNLTTALAGRISGLISYQRSGEPGQDNADFFVRGITTFGNGKANPLILIDGVELSSEDLSRLNTDDIASFSVMKDANATALYGARGANGVILISTKEGTEGKVKISVRAEESFSMPTRSIEFADPVTYMKLGNEAVRTRNPLSALPYSSEKIARTGTGNPYVYPATDWADLMLKDVTSNQRVNVNMSGGGSIARYYIAASYAHDSGILKEDKRNEFNNNVDLKKYLLRMNFNIKVTPTTEVIARLHGTFDDYTGPLDGGSGVYNKIMRTNPVLFPAYYVPDTAHKYTKHILFGNYGGGNQSSNFYLNPYADMVKGYKQYSKTLLLAQMELKQDLGFLLKGLSVRGMFNTTRYSYFDLWRNYRPYYYNIGSYDKQADTYKLAPLNERNGTEYISEFGEGGKDINTTIYWEAAAQYNNTFAEDHAVSGLLVFTGREELHGNIRGDLQNSFPYRNLSLSGRLTYAYRNKYFIEGNFGYNGSERFFQKNTFGFFPSIGVGYMLSNEEFWQPLAKTFSKLKLKATYGLVGNDAIGDINDRFFYLEKVYIGNTDRGYSFGTEKGYGNSGISISRYADPDITWETAYKQNYGIEIGLFDKLDFQMDYFREYRKNILMDRAAVPTTMGLQATPKVNIGEAFGSGVDMSLDYSHAVNSDLWFSLRGTFTYAKSKYHAFEEPAYEGQPWRKHLGQPLSQTYGLIAERLFIDDDDVYNSPTQMFGEYGAGDIKYKDINMDGKIDNQDYVPVGYPTTPEIIYGGGFSLGYRSFDLSAFFQGSTQSSFWINNGNISPFLDTDGDNNVNSQNALLQIIADSYWAEDNRNPHAFWPRLSNYEIENNTQTSTWWMRDGAFLRLKTIELGYTVPKKWTSKAHLAMARFYISGTNLLTWSKFKFWDPEMGGGGLNYPVQKVFNIGINVNL